MAAVSFHGIHKAYGKVQVIHGIGFDIADGEFVVLVGPSGCGKSTLPKLMLGFYQPQEGKVTSTAGRAIFAVHGVDQNGKAIFPGSPCQIRP